MHGQKNVRICSKHVIYTIFDDFVSSFMVQLMRSVPMRNVIRTQTSFSKVKGLSAFYMQEHFNIHN